MRLILVGNCGECPFFNEGEISSATGERWTDDSCLKGCGKITDKTKMLRTCKLSWAYSDDHYAD